MIATPLALSLALSLAPAAPAQAAAAQAPVSCEGTGAALRDEAAAQAVVFDLAGAAARLDQAAANGCLPAREGAVYLHGLLALGPAMKAGGAEASLAPLREAIAELERLSGGVPGSAGVARTVLLAAVAAAQTERDEMWLWIEQALTLERVQLEAGESGAPFVTAHEVAGDLWLQVYRYEDARRFFTRAADEVGRTPRVTLGLARAAARLKEVVSACAEYATFLWWWGSRAGEPAEVAEARAFMRQPACQSLSAEPSVRR